jgi:hypothetical protein
VRVRVTWAEYEPEERETEESSCERFNRYLDRSLVVPTLGHPPGLAFFDAREARGSF